MVLIAAVFEMVTEVGAPLLVNVAVLSGTVLAGTEVQLLPVVHSAPGPVQVPSVARAGFGASMVSAPSQTPPSSALRVAPGRRAGAGLNALSPVAAPPAGRAPAGERNARARDRRERISRAPSSRCNASDTAHHNQSRRVFALPVAVAC